jgi:Flp pilus assembly protein TadG
MYSQVGQHRFQKSLRHTHPRRGAVTVEFAITAGLAFFFFFASFEFSRVAMIRGTVDNAIYEGARAGVIPGATVADVQRKTQDILKTALIRRATITVSPNPILFADPTVTVSVDVPLDGNLFSPSMFFGGKVVSRSIQMKREAAKFAKLRP